MNESENPPAMKSRSDLTSYTCPGELYSISRGIHLARLAAFYSKCRECEHRFDAGSVVSWEQEESSTANKPTARSSLISEESVRGVYLNELDRNRAILWGESLAAYLWDQQPMIASRAVRDKFQIIAPAKTDSTMELTGPVVVVGFDERPSSPDIVTGVVLGLRRMGCVVVDLAQTSLPVVAFGVHSSNAAAGLFVTGAGCDPSVTGFEIMMRDGRPLPYEGLLQLEQSVKQGVGRQTRQIGAHKPHQILSDYIENLQPYFHALRPLRVVCGSSTRQMPRVLDRLFARLPCTLTHVALPTRKRDLFDGSDVDLQRVAGVVVEDQYHLGIVFDEDGRRAAFVTDVGRLASPHEVARMVIEMALRQQQNAEFVVSTSWLKDVKQWLTGRNAKVVDGTESVTSLVQKLLGCSGALALSADGRIWFRHSYLVCDALLIFAYLLQALSLSDASFSDVIARVSVNGADHRE